MLSYNLDMVNNIHRRFNKTDERVSSHEAKPAWENSSFGFIEAVHQG